MITPSDYHLDRGQLGFAAPKSRSPDIPRPADLGRQRAAEAKRRIEDQAHVRSRCAFSGAIQSRVKWANPLQPSWRANLGAAKPAPVLSEFDASSVHSAESRRKSRRGTDSRADRGQGRKEEPQ